MKTRMILGLSALGAIGAVYYAHQRRGGVLTVDSIRDSAKALGRWAKAKVSTAKDDVAIAIDEALDDEAFDQQVTPARPADEIEEIFPTPAGFAGGDGRFPGR